ncbi:hypothetical protein AKJ58_01290 [candidate division MSBL1 archaeon SCGC-AAA385D11]|uniref:Uncharacterized protein n=1 Tax=candidate division MSBL1 archaeon SCGC-AAA385D11 TaxID=1698286 RepID=A0A133VNI3_9EURY|nr:hypothetical protein AKJ58_01290 [candidate division MSBL1 archaeon SCGC-AAA385D11]
MDAEDLLKAISLESSREILQHLSNGPKTATELREECEELKNRVSFYKSLNRMAKLGLVKKYRDPELKRNVYELKKSRILVNLKRNEVRVE